MINKIICFITVTISLHYNDVIWHNHNSPLMAKDYIIKVLLISSFLPCNLPLTMCIKKIEWWYLKVLTLNKQTIKRRYTTCGTFAPRVWLWQVQFIVFIVFFTNEHYTLLFWPLSTWLHHKTNCWNENNILNSVIQQI